MIAADAEEPAEFKHGIVALARALVDHHIDDRTELFIFHLIDRGALNLLRGDQALGFGPFDCVGHGSFSLPGWGRRRLAGGTATFPSNGYGRSMFIDPSPRSEERRAGK